jgi:hypothetical protein
LCQSTELKPGSEVTKKFEIENKPGTIDMVKFVTRCPVCKKRELDRVSWEEKNEKGVF